MSNIINMPKFEHALIKPAYTRVDDEPLKFLEQIYPFTEVTPENEYFYECLLIYFSSDSMRYILPLLLDYLLNHDLKLSSNLSEAFDFLIVNRDDFKEQFNFVELLTYDEKRDAVEKLNRLIMGYKEIGLCSIDLQGLTAWMQLLTH